MNQFEKGLLGYLGAEKLAKLKAIKVGIAGAGGLGSNCAFNLVRAGFKNFTIVDFDVVEPSNLNRQFFFLDQLGEAKVEALKENLSRINPAVEVTAIKTKIEEHNIKELFFDCDVVVEAFDKVEYKKLIVETYLDTDKFLVAASGLAGWGNSDAIKIKQITPQFYLVGDGITGIGEDTPPISPRVNIAAAKQADIILNWVLTR